MIAARPLSAIILAAGKGTRMKSDMPKVLHAVCGLPMVEHIGRAVRACGVDSPVVVVGYGADRVREALGTSYRYALQENQQGTGDAARCAAALFCDFDGDLLITPGDTPLLSEGALQKVVDHHRATGAVATIATCVLDDAAAYGRIVKENGKFKAIVEHKDASPEQRAIKEINSAVYCLDAKTLLRHLPGLSNENAQGEFYLTDVFKFVSAEGGLVETCVFEGDDEFQGVNDRWELAEAGTKLRMSILKRHAINGVTIDDPATTFIGVDVEIGVETRILPFTLIEGKTVIGQECEIGPDCRICESTIDDEVVVFRSHVHGAHLKTKSRVGPFAHIRPKTTLGAQAKVGNFVEIKNASLGDKVAVSHLSYIGDARIGDNTNIGAGTITCNYDGLDKHQTVIGSNSFIGSNSTLVAPVTIGDDAMVAAGSTINKSVPDGAMAIGRGKQEVKEGWFKAWRMKKLAERR